MSEQSSAAASSGFSTIEKVAAASSTAIIIAGLVFWIIQIRGVMEMLEMAYG
ncbi:MAG: hypothetical protein WDZ30_08500 [Cellvibrionaceae bacterium]